MRCIDSRTSASCQKTFLIRSGAKFKRWPVCGVKGGGIDLKNHHTDSKVLLPHSSSSFYLLHTEMTVRPDPKSPDPKILWKFPGFLKTTIYKILNCGKIICYPNLSPILYKSWQIHFFHTNFVTNKGLLTFILVLVV